MSGFQGCGMSDQAAKTAAFKARRILGRMGIEHTVGTSWNAEGTPVVVVYVPLDVDRGPVAEKLADLGTEVVVRQAAGAIVAH
jgi:hypothetical protein